MGAAQPKLQPTTMSHGCWLGYQQKPLLPNVNYNERDLLRKNPFLLVKVKRMIRLDPEAKDTSDRHLIQLSIDSGFMSSTQLTVFHQTASGELKIVETQPLASKVDVINEDGVSQATGSRPGTGATDKYAPLEETDEEREIREQTSRQFHYEDVAYKETSNYLIYCVNTEPVEGDFNTKLNNCSPHHMLDVLVPRQYNCDWFESTDLGLETSVKGRWDGFSEYGGAPTDDKDDDWLLYNMHFLITVKNPVRAILTLTRTEGDFPIGLVVLARSAKEEDNYKLKDIESRAISHSLFPLENNEETCKHGCKCYLHNSEYSVLDGTYKFCNRNYICYLCRTTKETTERVFSIYILAYMITESTV
jgi:hypothetical protein